MRAPACHGSPVAVSHLCETCVRCASSSSCLSDASRFLEKLPDSDVTQRERLRIAVVRQALWGSPHEQGGGPPSTPTRLALTQDQEQLVAGLSAQVGSLVRGLLERGWFEYARRELDHGRNPGRNPWQRLLCAGLMRGGISRADLQMAFEQELSLKPSSAKVRVSKAVGVFLAGRLITEVSGKLVRSQG